MVADHSAKLNRDCCRITNVLVYYGLSLNSVKLGSNKYTSFVLVCLVELPAYIAVYVLIRRVGRRLTLCSTLLLSGACCLVVIVVPEGTCPLSSAIPVRATATLGPSPDLEIHSR